MIVYHTGVIVTAIQSISSKVPPNIERLYFPFSHIHASAITNIRDSASGRNVIEWRPRNLMTTPQPREPSADITTYELITRMDSFPTRYFPASFVHVLPPDIDSRKPASPGLRHKNSPARGRFPSLIPLYFILILRRPFPPRRFSKVFARSGERSPRWVPPAWQKTRAGIAQAVLPSAFHPHSAPPPPPRIQRGWCYTRRKSK